MKMMKKAKMRFQTFETCAFGKGKKLKGRNAQRTLVRGDSSAGRKGRGEAGGFRSKATGVGPREESLGACGCLARDWPGSNQKNPSCRDPTLSLQAPQTKLFCRAGLTASATHGKCLQVAGMSNFPCYNASAKANGKTWAPTARPNSPLASQFVVVNCWSSLAQVHTVSPPSTRWKESPRGIELQQRRAAGWNTGLFRKRCRARTMVPDMVICASVLRGGDQSTSAPLMQRTFPISARCSGRCF